MYKVCLALLLVTPAMLVAQSDSGESSSAMVASDSASASIAAPSAASPQSADRSGFFNRGVFTRSVHDAPVGSFTVSYVYQYSPNTVGANRSLMGWSAVPEVNFGKYIGFQGDFTSLYMRSVYPGQSRFMMAAGPRFNFAPHSRFAPFVFMEGGEMRATRQLSSHSDWNPVAIGGLGLNAKMSRGVSFQLIPGEYVGEYTDWSGQWNHTFMSRAGVTFNLYR